MILEKLEKYGEPKIELEQYVTNPQVAAELLFLAYLCGDIKGKKIYDLGTGVGTLAIGASLLGAKEVYGVDVDGEALEVAKRNAEKLKIKNIKWVNKSIDLVDDRADVVLQNPPFGTKKRKMDAFFLGKALQIGEIIYSIHKKGNMPFLSQKIKQFNGKITHILNSKLVIPHTFPHHRKTRYEVEVQILRIKRES